MQRDTYCSYCGQLFACDTYPKQCNACGNFAYLNAPTVCIGVVPINGGVLVIRRGIPPKVGELALPGGYKELNETWEQGVAREVFEETGIQVDHTKIKLHAVHNASNGAVMVFGLCPEMDIPEPIPFKLDHETLEAFVATEDVDLAFPSHQKAFDEFWCLLDEQHG